MRLYGIKSSAESKEQGEQAAFSKKLRNFMEKKRKLLLLPKKLGFAKRIERVGKWQKGKEK